MTTPQPTTAATTTPAVPSLYHLLPFAPNAEQRHALDQLVNFVQPQNPLHLCVLRGCAGTGKTSIIKALTDYLHQQQVEFRLAAPTGRAAQIIGKKTGNGARTVHATIFTPEMQEDGVIRFLPKTNPSDKFTIYIIDEASMLPDAINLGNEGFCQETSTLQRLIAYVQEGNPNSKLIFLGDTNQLPPIENRSFSPALNLEYLQQRYHLDGIEILLNQIERQQNGSYILENAENLRNAIEHGIPMKTLRCRNLNSFSRGVQGYLHRMQQDNENSAVMIAYTNKQVNAMNTWARKFKYQYKDHEPLKAGEWLMLNQNTLKGNDLLMRGTSFRVLEVRPSKPFAQLQFANAQLQYTALDGQQKTIVSKILLNTLTNQAGHLSHEANRLLVHEAIKHNRKYRESKNPQDDPFVGALRVRYGYALTCHKAQGGEWEHVFLNPLFNREDLKWCYTAITRASQHLYSWPLSELNKN
ncbi:MAG TPA: AAA family ATPase [Phnomibacter sp.]|nr:AAA family ATPase [Phnomibacter sp.]